MKSPYYVPLQRILACVAAMMLLSVPAHADETTGIRDAYIELSTEYPALTVKAGDSLNFDLSLENQSGVSQEIILHTESIPEGWTGSFSAGTKEVSIVHCMNC